MSNLNINNYHNLKFKLNYEYYYDFYVYKGLVTHPFDWKSGDSLYDACLISNIDMCDDDSHGDDDTWVYSSPSYSWSGCTNIGNTLQNISYTSVDNGWFLFRKDRILNKDFVKLFQEFKYDTISGDCRVKLHKVSGNTLLYDYPATIEHCALKLNGGFYQGFFRTKCGEYEVLPSQFGSGQDYHFEFTLKREDFEKESDKTLNDKYPENKGIFFYLGARSENKWIYEYDKDDVDGLEACFELGLDDFVEDGEIDKKDYIIGNFYDPNPDDVEFEDPFELGDYTNYNYFDDELYADDYCDWHDMDDYLEIDYTGKAKLIDETQPHSTIGWCCEEEDEKPRITPVLPFIKPCGCGVRWHTKKRPERKSEPSVLKMGDVFGEDGYIGDFEDLGDLKDCQTYLEGDIDITDFVYYTDNGFNLSEANWYYFTTDNKFLLFDRTKNGYTVNKWIEGTQLMYCGRKNKFKGNLFIYMNRTKTGYTVYNVDKLKDENANDYNPYEDLYENALAFRITDEGAIGYRMLTADCEKEGRDKTSILEAYSQENIIPYGEWATINVRMTFSNGKMKLLFYVDGYLKFISEELPMLNLRQLNDLYEKQEGVPYNLSLGGGTQGLAETIQYNYMLNPTRVYPLEKYFAGSFIGRIKNFRMYDCMLEHSIILNNYIYEKNRYNETDSTNV